MTLFKIRVMILHALMPVQKLMQHIGKPEPKIQSRFVRRVAEKIQDGDLLLSREDWRITNPFVPGFWGHAAIYYQGNVIEAVGTGVRSVDLYQWLYQKDSVALLRDEGMRRDLRATIGILAKSQIGKKYDYIFTANTKAFFCSELFAWAYNKIAKAKVKATSTPQELYEAYQFAILDESKN